MSALVDGIVRRERLAVARALNDVEDQRVEAKDRARLTLARIRSERLGTRAHRIGVTGPPGAGKSTLVAALARAWRRAEPPRTVAVLAVDPSSLRTGGALLGDRIRFAGLAPEEGLFVRSMATRGELGGIARAVPDSVDVLSAGFDLVVVETVGVGQSEAEVRDVVDTLILVLQPGAGDTIQHMKAGLMELPDLVIVNKSDQREEAERSVRELRAALAALGSAGVTGLPEVARASARDGEGVDELARWLDERRARDEASGETSRRRRAGRISRAMRDFRRRYGELGVEQAGGEERLREKIELEVALEEA